MAHSSSCKYGSRYVPCHPYILPSDYRPQRRRQKFAGGGFQQRINARVASGRIPPRKIDNFRPSEIVSAAFSEYTAKIARIMQTVRLALEAYTLASVAL